MKEGRRIPAPVPGTIKTGIIAVLIIISCLSAVDAIQTKNYVPIIDFSANVTSGNAPLAVQFTDISGNNPVSWAWYFGDRTYPQPWNQVTAHAGWPARTDQKSVLVPDGSIVLMGGGGTNETWRSTDNGTTWKLMTAYAPWMARTDFTSVAMQDGTVVLIGGTTPTLNDYEHPPTLLNDAWASWDDGASWTELTTNAGWSGRSGLSSVVMPDDSIVLMGGWKETPYLQYDSTDPESYFYNDVWRSVDHGRTWTQMTAHAGWSPRAYQASVVMPDGSIVVMGGWGWPDGGGPINGEYYNGHWYNDVWRSTDNGASWTEMTGNALWAPRALHTSVVMPDDSIVLMGGSAQDDSGYTLFIYNDTWRSWNNGKTWSQIPDANASWYQGSVGPSEGNLPFFDMPVLYQTSLVLPDGSIFLTGDGKNDAWRYVPVPPDSTEQNPSHMYQNPGTYTVTEQTLSNAVYAGGYNRQVKVGYIDVPSKFPALAETGYNYGRTVYVPPAGPVPSQLVLTPDTQTKMVGAQDILVAKAQDTQGNPVAGTAVTFSVTSGPNAGMTSTATTDASGNATFTYTSAKTGTDTIVATMTGPGGGEISSGTVTGIWTAEIIPRQYAGYAATVALLVGGVSLYHWKKKR